MLATKTLRLLRQTKCLRAFFQANQILNSNFPKNFHTLKQFDLNDGLNSFTAGITLPCRNYAKGKDKKKEKGRNK